MADRIQRTGRVREGLYIVNHGFVASYIVDSGDSLLAFDAGLSAARMRASMRQLGLDSSRVSAVFLTHSDRDHSGGATAFEAAKKYIARAELPLLDGRVPRHGRRIYNKALPFDCEALEDGQELRIGGATVSCIATPGHTPGSMSFLVNGRILVVGDELNLRKGKAVLDRKLICLDNAERERSLRRLAALRGVELICAAHSGYADFEGAMQG
jgi:Zn-dependent hydrolases, including glyoxylases